MTVVKRCFLCICEECSVKPVFYKLPFLICNLSWCFCLFLLCPYMPRCSVASLHGWCLDRDVLVVLRHWISGTQWKQQPMFWAPACSSLLLSGTWSQGKPPPTPCNSVVRTRKSPPWDITHSHLSLGCFALQAPATFLGSLRLLLANTVGESVSPSRRKWVDYFLFRWVGLSGKSVLERWGLVLTQRMFWTEKQDL